MMSTPIFFFFALAFAADPPREAACAMSDLACSARVHAATADDPTTPPDLRGPHAVAAARAYLLLFRETGEGPHLCSAKRWAARRSKNLPPAIAARLAKTRADIATAMAGTDVVCEERRIGSPPQEPAVVAASPASRSIGTAPTAVPVTSSPSGLGLSASPRAPVTVLKPEVRPPSEPLLPVTHGSSERRPGRPLVIAGSAFLGVGLALVGVAAYSGGRAAWAYREGVELRDEVQSPPDDDARTRHTKLETEYHTMLPLTVGTTITGVAAVVVGAVLSGVGGRRIAQRRTALVPTFRGLAFYARF